MLCLSARRRRSHRIPPVAGRSRPASRCSGRGPRRDGGPVGRRQRPSPASEAGQTETDWGRIWDTPADGLPRYRRASTPADGDGDRSRHRRSSSVDGSRRRRTIATDAADRRSSVAGYTTTGSPGPLERRRRTSLDMTGTGRPGCRSRSRPRRPAASITRDDPVRRRLPARLTAVRELHPIDGAGRATQSDRLSASMLQSTGPADPVRPSLGEARSCSRHIRGTSGRSRWSWAFS